MSTSDEDDLWRAIVENYGDRPELAEPTTPAEPEPEPEPGFEPLLDDGPGLELEPGFLDHLEDGFVPPPAPPVVPPRGPRLLAWLGILGVPCIVLFLFVIRVEVAPWAGLLLFSWFVGGFGYLVANMHNSGTDGDGWDDGAVV